MSDFVSSARQQNAKVCHFFTLPPELRLEVYKLSLQPDHTPSLALRVVPERNNGTFGPSLFRLQLFALPLQDKKTYSVTASLLGTCRQIYEESKSLLYSSAEYKIIIGESTGCTASLNGYLPSNYFELVPTPSPQQHLIPFMRKVDLRAEVSSQGCDRIMPALDFILSGLHHSQKLQDLRLTLVTAGTSYAPHPDDAPKEPSRQPLKPFLDLAIAGSIEVLYEHEESGLERKGRPDDFPPRDIIGYLRPDLFSKDTGNKNLLYQSSVDCLRWQLEQNKKALIEERRAAGRRARAEKEPETEVAAEK